MSHLLQVAGKDICRNLNGHLISWSKMGIGVRPIYCVKRLNLVLCSNLRTLFAQHNYKRRIRLFVTRHKTETHGQ